MVKKSWSSYPPPNFLNHYLVVFMIQFTHDSKLSVKSALIHANCLSIEEVMISKVGPQLLYQFLMLGRFASVSYSTMEIPRPTKDSTLFDFTTATQSDIDSWREVSDTVREPGMSKSVFSLQKTRLFQRAVMFAMINPQPNGAGFAGVQTVIPDCAASYADSTGLRLHARGQGQLKYWKIVLTDRDQMGSMRRYDYEQKFLLHGMSENRFEVVDLPFSQFKAYKWGKEVPDAPPLDLVKIGSFGFQTFGGVYDDYKQQGTGSLEVDFVSFY